MSDSFGIGLLGGRSRSLRRHLERRGDQTFDAIFDHYCCGSHSWAPEDLDQAIAELLEHRFIREPGPDGVIALTIRSPL